MKKTIYVLLAISITLNAFLLLKEPQIIEKQVYKQVVEEQVSVEAVPQVASDDFQEEYERAQEEIKILQNKIAALTLEQQLVAKSLEEPPSEVTTEFVGNSDEEMAKRHMAEREETLKLFDSESIDAEWAFSTQESINKTILDAGLLNNYDLQAVDCKASVCKLKIKPFSDIKGAGMSAMMTTAMALMENEDLRNMNSSFNADEDSESFEMLLRRQK